VVITRSWSSIFEFEALGLHMILIPHPHTGNNHQYYNAKIFERKWHECILQEDLTKELPWILEKYKNYKKSTDIPTLNLSIYEEISQKLIW
jgi:UDP-N-acetylglucosamine:LPS N-acetylglucosamine transferase